MIRFRKNSQRVVPVATSFECRLPGSLVLFGDYVVVQFPEEREHRRLELTQRRRGIVEVRPPNNLPLRMIQRSGERVGRRPHPGGEFLTSRCVLVPPLACSSELVLKFHECDDGG